MQLEVVVASETRKAKGSCYGGNERKHLSINSYGHKSMRDTMDIALFNNKKKERAERTFIFNLWKMKKKKKKKKIFTLKTFTLCVVHLVAFNHFARRHT
jgi:hypothetical protein